VSVSWVEGGVELGREIYEAVGLFEAVVMQLRLRRYGCENVACGIGGGG
jgi:hypothetical protein